MTDKNPQEKAWDTMRKQSPAKRASYKKNWNKGAKKAAKKVKDKQWEPEKVAYFEKLLKKNSEQNVCINCDDTRKIVHQTHHINPKKTISVILCANCHDIVRRGTLEDLKNAPKWKK